MALTAALLTGSHVPTQTHMKKRTLDVVQTARERLLTETAPVDSETAAIDPSTHREAKEVADNVILTEADPCVHEYCAFVWPERREEGGTCEYGATDTVYGSVSQARPSRAA